MYREFVYMDTDRIQSIIAQLTEGVLTQVITGKAQELTGTAGVAAGVLTRLLPINLEGSAAYKNNVQSSKILHDYAFNIALEALAKNDLLVEVQDWDRDEIPLPDSAFVLIRGSASILDYGILRNLAENEGFLDALLGMSQEPQPSADRQQHHSGKTQKSKSKKPSVLQQIRQFIDVFMGDSLQVRMRHSEGLLFVGSLSREFFREETRHFIFKYGGKPQKGWVMLAQVSQVPEPGNKLDGLAMHFREGVTFSQSPFNTATDAFNVVLEAINAMQEAIASVSYQP